MSEYQTEQLEALALTRDYLDRLSLAERKALQVEISDYLHFRQTVDAFLTKYFAAHCNQKCYQSRLSACCSKEGIITFFADVLINAQVSSAAELDELEAGLRGDNNSAKCVYLSSAGCRWRLKPINCEMFLCNEVTDKVFRKHPEVKRKWEALEKHKRLFTWPDRPVLFDQLEKRMIAAGLSSDLMYFHNSPGLLQVKKLSKQTSIK